MAAPEGLIRRARTHLGLTQAQLASTVGVHVATVSDAELSRNPSVRQLARYGQAMGLELRVFYLTKDGQIID